MKEAEKCIKKTSPLAYLLKLSRSGGVYMGLCVLTSAVSGILIAFPLYALYRIIVLIFTTGNTTEMIRWSWIVLWTSLAQLVFFSVSGIFSHITAFTVLRDIRYAMAKKMLNLPLGWFNKRTRGDLRKLFTEDVEKIELFIAHHIPDFVRAVITPLTIAVFLFAADWRLGLISLIPAVLGAVTVMPMYRNYEKKMADYTGLLNKMNGTIMEYIRGMSVVRAFNQTAASFSNYKTTVFDYFAMWKQMTKDGIVWYAAFLVLIESGDFFVLLVGGPLLLTGAIELSAFLIALILAPAYVATLKWLTQFSGIMTMNLIGVERLRATLEAPILSEPEVPALPASDNIAFCDVSFSYTETPALKNVSLNAHHGTLTALVGPSGAGKTTAAMLAARFYDPTSGRIDMDSKAYAEIGTSELMKRVSICFQDSMLFKGTIEDNIRMGNVTASFDDVKNAAAAARADEFIEKLPGGYKAQVSGDRTLSGGQIQRIAIARVLLKDSPIVVLDEATSYADPENERLIQDALNELLADKTVFVVAHRLKTVKHADSIIVFDKGRIVEQGTWDELRAKRGTFARMWESAEQSFSWEIGR